MKFLLIGLLLVLAGCGNSANASNAGSVAGFNVSIYTDTVTGCQYIVASQAGIIPRVDKGGGQVCIEGAGQ